MQVEHHKDYAIITLPEALDLINAPKFKEVIRLLYEQGCNSISIDCSQLKMIDAAGIGSLALYQHKLKNRGGELRLTNVNNPYIRRLFDILDLQHLVSIQPDSYS